MNKTHDTGSSTKTRQMTETYSCFNIFDNSAINREGLEEIQLKRKNWMTSDRPNTTLPFRAIISKDFMVMIIQLQWVKLQEIICFI